MEKEYLEKLKKKISELSNGDLKLRDLYLQQLANGTLQGPPVGYASIDKPWLKFYPEGAVLKDVPAKTAYELIYDKNKNRKNEIALRYFNKKITYGELFDNIDAAAKALKEIGVSKGDVVTIAMPTSPELAYILYAINRVGAIANAVDPRLKEDGFQRCINDTNSKYLIALDMCNENIKNIINGEQLKKVINLSPIESLPAPIKLLMSLKEKNEKLDSDKVVNWKQFIKNGKKYHGKVDEPYEKDMPLAIVYTGGTTGEPKAVVLTNDNFNTMAITQEISGYDSKENDTFLTFLPPFIAYCLVNAIHDPLYLGFENRLVPMFEPNDFPQLMAKYKPNHVLSGPILWDLFIKNKKIQNMDLSFLKSPISGGDVLNVELEKQVNEFFEKHNCKHKITQGYGMSEVSAAAVYSKDEAYQLGSVGIPYIKNTISTFVPESDKEVGYNQEGEICINTGTQMKEYLNNEKATNDILKLHSDGKVYVHTGDIGTISEDGNIKISGRIKRMIVRNGNKIFPSAIEDIIMQLDEIENCVVVAMPNSAERHVPIAHIILKQDCGCSKEELIEKINRLITEKLPAFNVPYNYVFRNDLPLTNINKISYKELENESLNYIEEKSIIDFNNSKTR